MIVYKITNTVNGKVYVGCDSSTNKHRWYYHRWAYSKPTVADYEKRLYRAFRKYGIEVFDFEVIETLTDEGLLLDREAYWITHYRSVEPSYGYNARARGTNTGYCRNVYRVKSPDGTVYETPNLPRFCAEHGISAKALYGLCGRNPTATSWRGWQCVRAPDDFPPTWGRVRKGIKHGHTRKINSKTLNWILVDPFGKETTVTNLKEFCQNNNLGYRCMLRVSSGERTHHKGWRVLESKPLHV